MRDSVEGWAHLILPDDKLHAAAFLRPDVVYTFTIYGPPGVTNGQ